MRGTSSPTMTHSLQSLPGGQRGISPWGTPMTAVLLLEPGSIINTGDAGGEFTAEIETLS